MRRKSSCAIPAFLGTLELSLSTPTASTAISATPIFLFLTILGRRAARRRHPCASVPIGVLSEHLLPPCAPATSPSRTLVGTARERSVAHPQRPFPRGPCPLARCLFPQIAERRIRCIA